MTRFSSRKTLFTYVYLQSGAHHLLVDAESEEEGSFFPSMMSIVATAFFMEAYLNHLGSILIPYWDDLEILRPRGKLNVILDHLHYKVDFSRRPYQSFTKVFKLRNQLAHGKTETVAGTWKRTAKTHSNPLKTQWEKSCNPKEARRRYEDFIAIINELHKKAGLRSSPFGTLAEGSSVEVRRA